MGISPEDSIDWQIKRIPFPSIGIYSRLDLCLRWLVYFSKDIDWISFLCVMSYTFRLIIDCFSSLLWAPQKLHISMVFLLNLQYLSIISPFRIIHTSRDSISIWNHSNKAWQFGGKYDCWNPVRWVSTENILAKTSDRGTKHNRRNVWGCEEFSFYLQFIFYTQFPWTRKSSSSATSRFLLCHGEFALKRLVFTVRILLLVFHRFPFFWVGRKTRMLNICVKIKMSISKKLGKSA